MFRRQLVPRAAHLADSWHLFSAACTQMSPVSIENTCGGVLQQLKPVVNHSWLHIPGMPLGVSPAATADSSEGKQPSVLSKWQTTLLHRIKAAAYELGETQPRCLAHPPQQRLRSSVHIAHQQDCTGSQPQHGDAFYLPLAGYSRSCPFCEVLLNTQYPHSMASFQSLVGTQPSLAICHRGRLMS